MAKFAATDPGVLGIFSIGVTSGSIAATLAASSPLFSLRWGAASGFFVPDRIDVGVSVDAAITTSVPPGLELIMARSFTASDSGGTAITLTGNNNKFQTTHDTSLVTDARIATTGALTAGTRTLDAQPFKVVPFTTGTAIGTPLELTTIYLRSQLYPIVLNQDEGFIIRNGTVGPATGTFKIHVAMTWYEVVEELN